MNKPKKVLIRNFDEGTYLKARQAALEERKTLGEWLTEAAQAKLRATYSQLNRSGDT